MHRFGEFSVFLFVLQSGTRSLAVSQLVLQARSVTGLFDIGRGQKQGTGSQRVQASYQLQKRVHGGGRCIGPEVPGSILLNFSGHLQTREVFVAQHQKRIRLVVLESNVVAGL